MKDQQNKKGNRDESVTNQTSKQPLDKESDPEHKRTRKPGSPKQLIKPEQ
jgi:hypothetical protein